MKNIKIELQAWIYAIHDYFDYLVNRFKDWFWMHLGHL